MEVNDKRRVTVYGTDGSEESLLEIVNKLSIDNIDAMIVETDLLKAAFGKYAKSNNVKSLETRVNKIIDKLKDEREDFDLEAYVTEHNSHTTPLKFKSELCCSLITEATSILEASNGDKGFNLVIILDNAYLELPSNGPDWENKVVCSYLESMQNLLPVFNRYNITYNHIISEEK